MGRSRNGKREAQREPREQREPAPRLNRTPELRGLCVVLFGMPAAGKSSLLGALSQAAQTQPGLLGGEMKDTSGGLAELQRRLYQDKAQETLDEIVPYPITFQPTNQKRPFDATLIDCDGRIAYAYLKHDRALGATQGQVNLAMALEQADGLLLVVDGSVEPAQLRNDFAQFAQFLRHLEDHRSRAAEVAGLPVYLVLTKCDLLADERDTSSKWLQRIEDAKRKISQRFKEFLAEEAHRENRAFGQIDLHVWATAVKRPALADKPARPTEPFGVAELFRQCFDSGMTFDRLQKTAERRLQTALVAIVGVLALVIALGAFFVLTRPSTELTALENAAQATLPPKGSTARERLRGALDEKRKEYESIIHHPEFSRLSPILQDRVQTAYNEMRRYQELTQRFKDTDRSITEITDSEALVSLEKSLRSIQIPPEYTELWKDLDFPRNLKTQQEKATQLRGIVAEFEGTLRKRLAEGNKLFEDRPRNLEDPNSGPWLGRVREYLAVSVPDAANAVPEMPEVKYQQLYRFQSIEPVLEDLQRLRASLIKAREKLLGPK